MFHKLQHDIMYVTPVSLFMQELNKSYWKIKKIICKHLNLFIEPSCSSKTPTW